eukprot:TRINITY_DN7315_c0_g1_i2.p1 TRINITY_DN7315_c0_g1~~TRINITY_DN7315_c0_g1_i2.p1  ORF type:complete len:398 (-),score=68.49 TRINITY_DN7315_c0_g1_i2:1141-2199(-)
MAVNKWASVMAVGMSCGDIVLYDMDLSCAVKILSHHSSAVTGISWFRRGKYIVSVGSDKLLCIWNILTEQLLFEHSLAFTPSACHLNSLSKFQVLLCGGDVEPLSVRIRRSSESHAWECVDQFKLEIGSRRQSTPGDDHAPSKRHKEEFNSFAVFSRCGRYMVSASSKGTMMVWDSVSNEVLQTLNLPGNVCVRFLNFSKDGSLLLVCGSDRFVRLVNFSANPVNLTFRRDFQDVVNRQAWKCGCISGNNEFLAAAVSSKDQHKIYIWNSFGQLVTFLEGPKEGIELMYWHPCLPIISVQTTSGHIRTWFKNLSENWSAFAPNFEVLEENVVYEEREDEFDMVGFDTGDKAK